MNENSLFLNLFLEDENTDSAIVILGGKQQDIRYFLKGIITNCDCYEKPIIMNFQKKDILLQKNFLTPNDVKILSPRVDDNKIDTFDERPTLRLGSTGPYVTELQRILTKLLYYTGAINGNFDTTTENAVKRFQTNNRLTVDGVVGRDTWSALSYLYSPLAICEDEPEQEYFFYTVVAGDSLWTIARRFSTTVSAIKSLNGLTSDLLNIGQVLKIPRENNEQNYTLYTVVAGDSLWAIARRFNTTVNAIKSLNGLTSDLLSIGQILRIPNQ